MAEGPVPPPAAPDLDSLLCFAVHAADLAFSRVYRPLLQRLGLTYPQYLVMVVLWGGDGITVGGLGQRLSLDTNTLTPLLKRLEALGLLTRRRSEKDERRVMVALTARGRAMQRDTADVTSCLAESVGLAAADLARLTRELQGLRTHLEQAAARAGAA